MLRRRSPLLASVSLLACSSAAPPGATASRCDAIVAVSDYTSSGVGGFALDGTGALAFGVDLGKDPALATSRGRAFFVDRLGGKILELDPVCGKPTGAVVDANDPAHGGTSNPQDVAVAADGSLWVPRYDVPSVLVVSPSTAGGAQRRAIDLAPFDPDGNPNPSAIAIADVNGAPKAFVTLERLDDTQSMPKPKLASQVLRIDVVTLAVEAAIDLAGKNPFAVFRADDGALWIAEPGDYYTAGEPDAGVERFDPSTSTSRLVAREADLGGSVAEVAVTAGCGAAIVADASSKNATSLAMFDPDTGGVIAAASSSVIATEGFDLEGLLWVGDVLLVGDRRATPRGYAVHAFARGAGCTLQRKPDAVFLAQKPVALRASAR